MQFGKTRITPLALALTLTVGVAAVAVPAAASSDVSKYTEEADQARSSLDRAKAQVRESAKARDTAVESKEATGAGVHRTVAAVDKARADVVSARVVLGEIDQKVKAATERTEASKREEGLLDVAAKAAEVAAGDTESGVLGAAVGVVKAGLTGLMGPVIGMVDPVSDAMNGKIEQAENDYAEARRQEQALRQEQSVTFGFHREATAELARLEQAKAEARAAHRASVRAEKKAAEQHVNDAEAEEKAAAAVKKAEAALEEAKAEAKKAREKAREKAAKAASSGSSGSGSGKASSGTEQRRAAASGDSSSSVSRSADTRETVRPATGQTTSPYGMRTHPITGVHKLHSGTDFGYGDGNAYAARSGTISAVTYDGGYGNMVTIDHGGGIETRYAHLANATVSVGEKVSAGSVVGRIGSTGYSTGPHLHFEVLKNGEFIDPMGWLGG